MLLDVYVLDRDCFGYSLLHVLQGTDFMFHLKTAFKYSNTLVSRHCKVISCPMSVFAENVTEVELIPMIRSVPKFPTDKQLIVKFVHHSVWETYKRKTVDRRFKVKNFSRMLSSYLT